MRGGANLIDVNVDEAMLDSERVMETFLANLLHARGQDLKRLYAARARMVYRKPCFRGEGYRRAAWFAGEAPLTLAGAFFKEEDEPGARPAAVIEVTYRQHEAEA